MLNELFDYVKCFELFICFFKVYLFLDKVDIKIILLIFFLKEINLNFVLVYIFVYKSKYLKVLGMDY